ncbi:hypothetical protein KSC_094560 [Ktedonobacter sp. SOSP1-52]|nr:hypothetical protein KSC_094560 [Ktedonobacter sp. SOSP1-52]
MTTSTNLTDDQAQKPEARAVIDVQEIRKSLPIGEKTVKGHVSNTLGKLHMVDRIQAAVFAWQQGLAMLHDP